MVSNKTNLSIDGREYDFDSSGACLNPSGRKPEKAGWYKRTSVDYGYYYDNKTGSYRYGEIKQEKWFYYDSNMKECTGWQKIGGKWYYFSDMSENTIYKGEMLTGFVGVENNQYYMAPTGEMMTGWIDFGLVWRYAKPDGSLFFQSWYTIGGKQYYFDGECAMISNEENFLYNGKSYSFDKNGVCLNPDGGDIVKKAGWYRESYSTQSNYWYYLDQDGNPCKGWKMIGGRWYHFNDHDGTMATYFHTIDGKPYYFKENGEMLKGWFKSYRGWIYAKSNGELYRNEWLCENGKWYYFDGSCQMVSNLNTFTIGSVDYAFDSNGVCLNPYGESLKKPGWFKTNVDTNYREVWQYYDNNGQMYKEKWLKYGGQWYYFNENGEMLCNCFEKIDAKFYDFDEKGVCLNPNNPRDTEKYYGN